MTAPNEYEPSAESVEALAKELHEVGCRAYGADYPYRNASPAWASMMRAEARFVLKRQRAREDAILAPVEKYACGSGTSVDAIRLANDVCNARFALDAPKVPTLLEAAKAVASGVADAVRYSINGEHLAALKAAVEREERK